MIVSAYAVHILRSIKNALQGVQATTARCLKHSPEHNRHKSLYHYDDAHNNPSREKG